MDPAAARLAPLLAGLTDYERTRPDRRLWDLATVKSLLARPGAARVTAPAVQVGGSKGKGTTCAFLDALAGACGLRAGVYLSPHVDTLLERIRVGGTNVEVERLEGTLRDVLAAAAKGERAPTFFEAMTVAAVETFARERVDLAVFEVGLGGRFDATTAVPVDASIVTTIELEHTDVLGPTVEAIAAEKAHVVRPGGHGFTGTDGAALAVIRSHARAVGASLDVLGEDFGFGDERRWDRGGFRGALRLPSGRTQAVFLPDARAFELQALALAAAAFERLLPAAPLALDPAPRPVLPCRFEVRTDHDGAVVVLDGAHTERSLAAVAAEVQRRWPGARAAVLFGSAKGKRWREGLSALFPIADRFAVTEPTGTAGEDPAAIAQWLRGQGRRSEVTTGAAAGLAALRGAPGPRLVVGSFYLAGEVRRLLDADAQRTEPR